MEPIARRLSTALEIRQLTIAEVSRRSGIDTGSIAHYKKGDYLPKQDKIYLLSVALDVSPAWLMGYEVPMDRDTPETATQSPDELLAFALYGDTSVVTSEDLEDIRKFAEYVKEKRQKENN